MKAITYSRYGGADVLEYTEDAPDPKVGPDSVLIKVRAASVNPVDWKCREGYLDGLLDAVFPVVPGWDVSGVVVRPGAAVSEYAVGDEVIGYVREDFLSRGTFAEYVAAPVRTLARKPRNLSFEEAAGLPLVGLTAYQVLSKVLRVRTGETVLVHAAAGGVGSVAVQLARRHLGAAHVIGTASVHNHDFVRELGGDPVTYGEGMAERVRKLAPGVSTRCSTRSAGTRCGTRCRCWCPGGGWCRSRTRRSSGSAARITSYVPMRWTFSTCPNWLNTVCSRCMCPTRFRWSGRRRRIG